MADKNRSSVGHGKGSSAAASSKPREPEPEPWIPFEMSQILLLGGVFYTHLVAAFQHPIQDCDEVFNYWEPTHYLSHGHGFQTWEYAPTYAIRSWAYAGLHALVIWACRGLIYVGNALPSSLSLAALVGGGETTVEFYFLRTVFAVICLLCEWRLSNAISKAVDEEIGAMFLLVIIFSAGMWHASVAYLPSTFTMYTTMLGTAAFMEKKTAQGIFAIGVGAVLGWPFAAAMAIPFLLYELVLALQGSRQDKVELSWQVTYGSLSTLLVPAVQVAIDSYYYGKPVVVPFNIINYNIFSSTGGPDLYGTEPWHFYFRNLFLNFHIWFLFALLSLPILYAQHLISTYDAETPRPTLRQALFLTPFYLWLAIFTIQPHKEERFIYPAYPLLILNASQAFHTTFNIICTTNPVHSLITKIPLKLRLYPITVFSLGAGLLGILRVAGTINAFSAPLQIYTPLHGLAQAGDTICLGKEWYRFPSHFLLPTDVEAKLIKSEFSGLLPGEFGAHPSIEPAGMNDENREDMGKYTPLRNCTFLVDVQLPSTVPTELEPAFVGDGERWERVKCVPFLDAASTGVVGRMVYVPNWSIIPRKFRRVYGDYCLLRRRKVVGNVRGDPVPHIETLG